MPPKKIVSWQDWSIIARTYYFGPGEAVCKGRNRSWCKKKKYECSYFACPFVEKVMSDGCSALHSLCEHVVRCEDLPNYQELKTASFHSTHSIRQKLPLQAAAI